MTTRRALPVLFALAALAGCGKPKDLSVDHAWVRLPAVPRQPGAAYFTIHAGPTDLKLIDVTTDVAIGSEMHENAATGPGGAMTMRAIRSVSIPARGVAAFQPGGRHVMLFDINPGIKPGGTMALTLQFADGTRVEADAPVVAAGAPAPKD